MLVSMEIDFDIHRAIENERRSFDEPPHIALRRLLKLPTPKAKGTPLEMPTAQVGRPWREGTVEVPHGSEARMSYQRGAQVIEGRFLDGKLVVNGQEFDTLSSAASAMARTRGGGTPSLNGWNYWEAKFPGRSEWLPLSLLRRKGAPARF